MRVSICVGNYAKAPYYIAGLDLSVYCMEELCFCIRENAFLIDTSLMNDNLVNWIGRDCGLSALARELYSMVHKKGSLSAFVTLLLEYTGLYELSVVREVEQVLKKGAGLNIIEKRKSQIDFQVRKKKYAAAIKGYQELLSRWEELDREGRELPAGKVLAEILHNLGAAYAGLMLYGQAAKYFYRAYERSEDKEEFAAFLAAKRLELPEEGYVAFAAELKDDYNEALQLEKQMEEIKLDWHLQPESLRLRERTENKLKGSQHYLEESEQLIQAIKSTYRSSVGEV